jgi:hypothetical protein
MVISVQMHLELEVLWHVPQGLEHTRHQIFAAFANATVPNDNISSCVGFGAITEIYNGTEAAAWEYT